MPFARTHTQLPPDCRTAGLPPKSRGAAPPSGLRPWTLAPAGPGLKRASGLATRQRVPLHTSLPLEKNAATRRHAKRTGAAAAAEPLQPPPYGGNIAPASP
jgi:hypothetical protein